MERMTHTQSLFGMKQKSKKKEESFFFGRRRTSKIVCIIKSMIGDEATEKRRRWEAVVFPGVCRMRKQQGPFSWTRRRRRNSF